MAVLRRPNAHRFAGTCATGVRMVLFLGGLAFGGLALAGEARDRGRELFTREWVPGDPRSHGGDGLGPLYNESSCVACHHQGGVGGAGGLEKNVEIVTLASGTLPTDQLDELHPGFRNSQSLVFHLFSTEPEYRIWRLRRTSGLELADMAQEEGEDERTQLKESLGFRSSSGAIPRPRQPTRKKAKATRPAVGHLLLNAMATFTERNAPPLFGMGLIDALPVEVLREVSSQLDPDFPETRGRLVSLEVTRADRRLGSRLRESRVGRFGWKAQIATLEEFVLLACANELGLEVPGHHQPESPLVLRLENRASGSARGSDSKASPKGLDMNAGECGDLVAFVGQLPAPLARTLSQEKELPFVTAGRELFTKVGCGACHRPKLGPIDGIYSDLLLHDMGRDLAESSVYYGTVDPALSGAAKAEEWRTPPLWGFRDSAPYLHDGRATTLDQAVAFHGGQAERTAVRFFKLSPRERLEIQTFLNSLAAPPAASEP